MEQEYLSVRQFAKRAGVTTQRIYQMMNKSLKSYCKVEDGKKYISADGLKIFERAEMEKNSLQEVASDLPRPNFRSCNSENTAYNADFQKENNETAEKDLQRTYQDQILGLATLKIPLIMPIFRKKTMKMQKKTCKDLQRTYQDQILGLATH